MSNIELDLQIDELQDRLDRLKFEFDVYERSGQDPRIIEYFEQYSEQFMRSIH